MNVQDNKQLIMASTRRSNEKESITGRSVTFPSGWKHYPEFPYTSRRSFPGNPVAERHKIYHLPYGSLNSEEKRAARDVLDVDDEDSWEKATPRRLCGYSCSTVLVFQTNTWNGLSDEQQKAATSHLDLNQDVWDNVLSAFHDEHWIVPGITFTNEQFDCVLNTLCRMADRRVLRTNQDLVSLLLQTRRVLTPRQAREIVSKLREHNCWNTLNASKTRGRQQNVHTILASFLTKTEKFTNLDSIFILAFWDDNNSGCIWGNFGYKVRAGYPVGWRIPSYADTLATRQNRSDSFRHRVAAILSGCYSDSVLPALDKGIVVTILNDWVGDEPPIDPHWVSWPEFLYGRVPLLDIAPRLSISEDEV